MNGKKTYILVIIAALAGLLNYIHGVMLDGFDLNNLMSFVNSEAMIVALATLRAALKKKA